MFCRFCGKELEEGSPICTNCAKPVISDKVNANTNVEVEEPTNPKNEKLANTLCMISLILFFGGEILCAGLVECLPFLKEVFSVLAGVCPLTGIVLMIIARVKAPKNRFALILMWIYIALFIVCFIMFIIMMIFVVFMCGGILTQIDWNNCG